MIVTIEHLHAVPTWNGRVGYCHRKSREFFNRYGLDWRKFTEQGIDADELRNTGDALAIQLVEFAESQSGQ